MSATAPLTQSARTIQSSGSEPGTTGPGIPANRTAAPALGRRPDEGGPENAALGHHPDGDEETEEGGVQPATPEAAAEGEAALEPIRGEVLVKEDSNGTDGARSSRLSSSSTGVGREPRRLPVQADLTITAGISRGARLADTKTDAVRGELSMGSSLKKGSITLKATSFGQEHVEYQVDSAAWKKADGRVKVSARVFLDIHWDIQSTGNKDVSGPEDAEVKKESWDKIVADLTPSASGRAPRKKYWAKDLTERHERFHASDDIGRTKLYIPTAQSWLTNQTVTAEDSVVGRIKTSFEVVKLLETVRSNVEADGWAYYDKAGGAGEDRAYAEGKEAYQKRADEISDRATKEKWG